MRSRRRRSSSSWPPATWTTWCWRATPSVSTLRVLGATTTHLLKMPSAKDVNQYRRGFARVLDLPFNRQELTINVRAAGDLYKKLVEATEGYAGDVPIIHQAVAVKAAIDALDASFQEDRDANF